MITAKIKITAKNKMALLRAIGDVRTEISVQPEMSISSWANQISFDKGECDYKYTLQVDDESETTEESEG